MTSGGVVVDIGAMVLPFTDANVVVVVENTYALDVYVVVVAVDNVEVVVGTTGAVVDADVGPADTGGLLVDVV